MTDGRIRRQRLVLTGYSDQATAGVVDVRSFDRAERLVHAWKGLALAWTGALVGFFIPVAHFLLVPGFVIAGVVLFRSKLGAREITESMTGSCPDCGLEQDFGSVGRWEPPHTVTCKGCHRSLTAKAAHNGGS